MNEERRKKIREWFAIHYGTCLSKKTGLIAKEHKPHLKTGKIKKLVRTHKGAEINVLPSEAIKYAQETKHHDNKTSRNVRFGRNCKLIDYALHIPLKKDTGRGDVLCRNAAIFFNNNCETQEADNLMQRLVDVQQTGNITWLGWVREVEGQRNDFSCGELRQWLRASGQENVEQLTCWRCNWSK